MFGGDFQQHLGRAGGLAPALFPVLERVLADAEQPGKLGLRQPELVAHPHHIIGGLDLEGARGSGRAAFDGGGLFHALQQFGEQFVFHSSNFQGFPKLLHLVRAQIVPLALRINAQHEMRSLAIRQ